MAQSDHAGRHSTPANRAIQNQPTNVATSQASDEDMVADVDEPPDLERTPRPSGLKLHDSFKSSFLKAMPRCERRESLLTTALHSSNNSSPVEETSNSSYPRRGMSTTSTWSNTSTSTAELTSDDGLTSPGARTCTPSPPPPSSLFHRIAPIFGKKHVAEPVAIVRHDDDSTAVPPKAPVQAPGEVNVEATLGRKRCISFACGRKASPKPEPVPEASKASAAPEQATEPPKRACTIKFACPSKISTDAISKTNKPRRAASPAPQVHRSRASPNPAPKAHRDSDSTVRNPSPVSVRKVPVKDRSRRLSANSDLAHTEAFRFHEFASSEEEVDEWVQESTCHRSRLTISDTLRVENTLRQLGEEAEEEAIDEEEEEDDEDLDEIEDDEDMDDDDEDAEDDEENESEGEVSDEGFHSDDEEGFAHSDDESDAGSDFGWWAPGAYSTAATSMEHLEHIRPSGRRSISESSIGSLESGERFKMPERPLKRKKSRPVNIRVPSPELPDSTDFVCGTLDEDRPLEEAYMSCLERRRAAKHKVTPQDIDPTFPTSDPEMDEEDEDDDEGREASESDAHLMFQGQMDHLDSETRGRRSSTLKKRSPAQSPRRLRSPPPAKRVHRSPPPRKLFGQSPRRMRSPAPHVRLRSPPPTRRGSAIASPTHGNLHLRFAGLAERPALTMSSSLPRTPVATHPPEDLEAEDTAGELPVRRAIDIKIGLENKRLRRKEQQYRKTHRKGCKDKKPAPGKGAERMREMGLGLAAHKGKTTAGLAFGMPMPPTPEEKDMHVLSI